MLTPEFDGGGDAAVQAAMPPHAAGVPFMPPSLTNSATAMTRHAVSRMLMSRFGLSKTWLEPKWLEPKWLRTAPDPGPGARPRLRSQSLLETEA